MIGQLNRTTANTIKGIKKDNFELKVQTLNQALILIDWDQLHETFSSIVSTIVRPTNTPFLLELNNVHLFNGCPNLK